MLNSIGLQGPGIESFIENDLDWLRSHGVRTVVSIAGGRVEEYVALARALYGHPAVSMIEVNISCPNVESRGQVFACDVGASSRVIAAVRRAADPKIPIFAKLTPDVTDIVSIARACADAGADGVSLINTLLGMVIDTDTLGPDAGRGHRRAVRAGDPPGRGALRLAGAPGAARRCRSSAWAASAPGSTRCSSSWPAPRRCRSARRCSATRWRRCGSCAELDEALDERGFASLRDAIGLAHLPRDGARGAGARAAAVAR